MNTREIQHGSESPGQVCSCLVTKISPYQIPASLQLPGTVLEGINVSLGAEHTASQDDLECTVEMHSTLFETG